MSEPIKTKIPAEMEPAAVGGMVTDAKYIIDRVKNKNQTEINTEVGTEITNIKGGSSKSIANLDSEINGNGGIDERLETVEQLAEISIGGGDAQIATGSDFTNPDATKRAKVPTVGAVLDGLNDGIYDVSKRNPTGGENSDGKFTLAYILANADTLIPTSWRHGGMTISFVDSSDNKYVQYRLMADSWSTTVSDWYNDFVSVSQNTLSIGGEEKGELYKVIDSIEFAEVHVDSEGKITFGVKQDGTFYFGAGCPPQVKEYVETYGYNKEVIDSIIVGKVDKVTGKSLINSDFADNVNYDSTNNVLQTEKPIEIEGGATVGNKDNPEFISLETDSENKMLSSRRGDGTKTEYAGFEVKGKFVLDGATYFISESPEYMLVLIDSAMHLLGGIKTDGTTYISDLTEIPPIIKSALENLANTDTTLSERISYIENLVISESKSKWYEGYDVCIVGGGAAGVFAAYALKQKVRDYGLKVCIIEKQPYLGGTHTQGYVSSLAPTPAPLFLDDIIKAQISKGRADLSDGEHNPIPFATALNTDFKATYGTYGSYTHGLWINIDPDALSEKYYNDLKDYIDIFTSDYITSVESADGVVISVNTHEGKTIYANNFIDCTGNDVLIRLAGGRTVYGGDANNRYESEYGFTEEHAYTQNYDFCNCASVMYRVRKGTEDLSNIGAYYTDWGAFFKYVTNMPVVYVNTVSYIDGDSGMKIINQGVDAVYAAMAPEMIRHWKRIKNGCLTTPQLAGVLDGPASSYRFDSVAPMLGIRETWRTMCERMLNENSLYVQVSAEETADNDLDKTIAVGSYIVDLLNDPYITAEQREYIDSHRKRYAVPYGSIVPKGFTNVLVASRGAGFTHIAASSFRLTKNMMQLGWAAGWAALYKIENSLTDFRDVDISTVQSEDYASITQMIQKVLS